MVSLGSSAASEFKISLELLLFVAGKLQGHGIVNVAKRSFSSLFRDLWCLQKAVSECNWKYIEPVDNKPFLCRLSTEFFVPYPFPCAVLMKSIIFYIIHLTYKNRYKIK